MQKPVTWRAIYTAAAVTGTEMLFLWAIGLEMKMGNLIIASFCMYVATTAVLLRFCGICLELYFLEW